MFLGPKKMFDLKNVLGPKFAAEIRKNVDLVKWVIHVQKGPGEIDDPCTINSRGGTDRTQTSLLKEGVSVCPCVRVSVRLSPFWTKL